MSPVGNENKIQRTPSHGLVHINGSDLEAFERCRKRFDEWLKKQKKE